MALLGVDLELHESAGSASSSMNMQVQHRAPDANAAAAGSLAQPMAGPTSSSATASHLAGDLSAEQQYLDRMTHYDDHVVDPLLQAAAAGNVPAVQMLLGSLGSSAHSAGPGGWAALHAAADNGQLQVVELLLSAGADVNAVAAYDPSDEAAGGQEETPMHLLSWGVMWQSCGSCCGQVQT